MARRLNGSGSYWYAWLPYGTEESNVSTERVLVLENFQLSQCAAMCHGWPSQQLLRFCFTR